MVSKIFQSSQNSPNSQGSANGSIERNPVVLVHGINDTTRVFQTLELWLRSQGWDVHSFNMTPNNGSSCLTALATQVESYIQKNFAPEQKIDLLGFSMGGVISRYYLQRLGGVHRVDRFISIAAPNQGTQTAYLSHLLGCTQMRPNSEFLTDLNRDGAEILNQVKFTSIWSPLDLMIVPAQSSKMPLGSEVIIPVAFHGWIIKDPQVLKAITIALSS